MTKYEELLDEAYQEGLYVIERASFNSHAKGLINGDVIGLSKDIKTDAERGGILAEELGHYYTTSGNILDTSNVMNRKQELRARVWGYQRIITMDKLISAYYKGCRNAYELSKELEVTEDFFLEALQVFKQKYSPYIQYKDYLIRFEPNLQIYNLTA